MSWFWWIIAGLGLLLYIGMYLISITFFGRRPGRNPFVLPSVLASRQRITPDDVVGDDRVRDSVLKQSFSVNRVPDKLDAIVIGSGIGGLSAACLLAKARRRVLVLEQHDVIGGCCHTFVDKGYEFDVGIHYIGELHKGSFTRTLVDQITDCKLQWAQMDCDAYDCVVVGEKTKVNMGVSREKLVQDLLEKFPKQSEGLKKFFNVINELKRSSTMYWALKLLPLRLSLFLAKSGLAALFSSHCRYATVSVKSVLDSAGIDDYELRTVLCYCLGDYGVAPNEASMLMHAMLFNHYQRSGAYYPVGGASEIAFNMVPIIEKAGGKALVRASVSAIVCNEAGRAIGVQLQRSDGVCTINAPLIISAAGMHNTAKLLPQESLSKSRLPALIGSLKPGISAFSMFIGLRVPNGGAADELGIKRQNLWYYPNAEGDVQKEIDSYASLDLQEAAATDPPFVFASFPSLKDPTWSRRRGTDRLTCAIVSLANWEWFSQWQEARVKHRGSEYQALKDAFGHRLWNIVKSHYPQLEDLEIELMDIGTPLSNQYYIGAGKGEIYGLHHDLHRMSPAMSAQLRPDCGVPGLLLSGQDVAVCGFTGALMGGIICASAALNRNLVSDLVKVIQLERKGVVRTVAPPDALPEAEAKKL